MSGKVAFFVSLGLVIWIWPLGPISDLFRPITPKKPRGPQLLLPLGTLPNHRYSKLPLFLMVLFFPFLTWVKISMETCAEGLHALCFINNDI